MSTDLSFITNVHGKTLKDRFECLIKDTHCFDCLVGYFYLSGFHAIYPVLECTHTIRILIGIGTDTNALNAITEAQQHINFSHVEAKQEVEDLILQEMEEAEESATIENGIRQFIEWIGTGKLEIRAYPSKNLHAKLYIMTFEEDDRDVGRVITGSSNFTQSGLIDNLEFNVELKNRSDYEFAREKFEALWADAVDVCGKYVQTVQQKTWMTQDITPYELYLKFLYEYFKDELNQSDELFVRYLPQGFKKLEYQEQAVLNAKKILLEYGGVFISDVVGLGKTYIAAMLAGQLEGRTLVIAPPVLLERSNPGSWPNVFADFRVPAEYQSIGKLDDVIERGTEKISNIIIDEAHRFRTETTSTYEKLAEICRGKRVILVTATPYNNSPKDILSLLKLFQKGRKSTIPNLPDLELFFGNLEKRVKKLDRKKDRERYIEAVRMNAKEIREKVLKYLMVRRTRREIERYFPEDIRQQGLKFPEVSKPEPLFYELDQKEDDIFDETISLVTEQLTFARYTPMLYHQGELDTLEAQSQRNMGRFMKVLLVKRLESSFFAFRNTVNRFLTSYDMFLRALENGHVYISKKHANKIFEFLENDDDAALQRLVDEDKAEKYDAGAFKEQLAIDLELDKAVLLRIKSLWENVERDPKLLRLKKALSEDKVLCKNHLVLFTESKETAQYLFQEIDAQYPGTVLLYTGDSGESVRDKVIANFDARARMKSDEHRILVSTEVLAEGVNLHRSNVVINYDIPWNPTRMMQRVGRINRIDTPFDVIYTYNFLPTTQSNDEIKLMEAAEGKINAFLTLLGGDAELLTEGEPIGSHELFDRLTSEKALEDGDEDWESELKYLQVIREIREKDAGLFARIKRLPKKARTSKKGQADAQSLVTYFRKGKLQKFFQSRASEDEATRELDFITTAKLFQCPPSEKRRALPAALYSLLDRNKEAFIDATTEETAKPQKRSGLDGTTRLLRILRAVARNAQQLTDDQESYLEKTIERLDQGALPKQTVKNTLKALELLGDRAIHPVHILSVLHTTISERLLEGHYTEGVPTAVGKREVILSLYLAGD